MRFERASVGSAFLPRQPGEPFPWFHHSKDGRRVRGLKVGGAQAQAEVEERAARRADRAAGAPARLEDFAPVRPFETTVIVPRARLVSLDRQIRHRVGGEPDYSRPVDMTAGAQGCCDFPLVMNLIAHLSGKGEAREVVKRARFRAGRVRAEIARLREVKSAGGLNRYRCQKLDQKAERLNAELSTLEAETGWSVEVAGNALREWPSRITLLLACRRCSTCRANRARKMTALVAREINASLDLGHKVWFITATYDGEGYRELHDDAVARARDLVAARVARQQERAQREAAKAAEAPPAVGAGDDEALSLDELLAEGVEVPEGAADVKAVVLHPTQDDLEKALHQEMNKRFRTLLNGLRRSYKAKTNRQRLKRLLAIPQVQRSATQRREIDTLRRFAVSLGEKGETKLVGFHVIERGGETGRLHHHMIIHVEAGELRRRDFDRLWSHGEVRRARVVRQRGPEVGLYVSKTARYLSGAGIGGYSHTPLYGSAQRACVTDRIGRVMRNADYVTTDEYEERLWRDPDFFAKELGTFGLNVDTHSDKRKSFEDFFDGLAPDWSDVEASSFFEDGPGSSADPPDEADEDDPPF